MAEMRWELALYVSGASPHSMDAISAITHLCATELAGRSDLRIVDVNDEPETMRENGIIALPTLIKRTPPPLRRLVGDLSDLERLRRGLDLGTGRDASATTAQAPP